MHKGILDKPGRVFFTGRGFVTSGVVGAALLAAAIFCFIGVAHSSGGSGRPISGRENGTGISEQAIEHFWTIYHGNDYDAIPEVQKELEIAVQSDPNNPTLYALLGATHFWHVGEQTSDKNPQADRNVLLQDMPTAAALFQKAVDLDYYTPHPIGYINDDHLPGYLGITTVHTGQEFGDLKLSAKGDQILDFAAYQFQNSTTSTAGQHTWTTQGTLRATRKPWTRCGSPSIHVSEPQSTARTRT